MGMKNEIELDGSTGGLAIAALFSLAMGQAALAQGVNLVQNGSFEDPGYPGDNICGRWWYNVGWAEQSSATRSGAPSGARRFPAGARRVRA